MVSFFCVLAPEGMNAIVFGEKDGEGDRRLWLILILSPRCCHADKMISPAIIVYDKYKGDFFNIHIKWGLTHLLI